MEQVAYSLCIEHSMEFDKTPKGTAKMFAQNLKARGRWMSKLKSIMTDEDMDDDERLSNIKSANQDSFFVD